MAYTYKYPRPSVTTDCMVFLYKNNSLKVLLIRRGGEPFKDKYALPGGFLEMDEDPEAGALRELEEEAGLQINEVYHLGAFGKVDRDPRGRTISLVYYTVLKENEKLKAASDATEADWHDIKDIPELAFDHNEIINKGVERLQNDIIVALHKDKELFNLSKKEMNHLLEIL